MMRPRHLPLPFLTLLAGFAAASAFALFTGHVWEDYYITYRSSLNLATGAGLVFNPGEPLHTFTSPLGVLLPAVASLLTGNTSDEAALWIFRMFCAAAFGGAAALVVGLVRRLGWGAAALLPVAGLLTDAKSLDFTINGMETAFMLLFLAWAFHGHLTPGPRQYLRLGAAWAGLMWTRPDSFIYVGLIAIGCWLFNDAERSGHDRRGLIGLFLRAGLVTTALYLPWLLWATAYYGSPIPHTIVAKGTIGGPKTLAGVLQTAATLPWIGIRGEGSLGLTFLPSYFMIGGWPGWLVTASRIVATAAAVVWLVPGLRREARAASFAFFGAHVYLSYFPYFPFPWYLPATTLLALIALGGAFAPALAPGRPPVLRAAAAALVAVGLAGALWTTGQVARQVEAQQRIVEDGNRRRIGEWLRANADPSDTVFMEPLGYIGFFSGLRTYDFPGMSSLEMVNARRRVGEDWGLLIQYLQPTWLVLRPFEAERIRRTGGNLLTDNYRIEATFDRTADVAALDVRGKPYLTHDAHFDVYRLQRPLRYDTRFAEIVSEFPTGSHTIEGIGTLQVHAPGTMVLPVPKKARRLEGRYGFAPGAWEGEPPLRTDGAEFRIEFRDGARQEVLLARHLDPTARGEDRSLQAYVLELPARRSAEAVLLFRTLPGQNTVKDWTCWSLPEFR